MAWQRTQAQGDWCGRRRRFNRVGVFGVADDADDTVLGKRAGRPSSGARRAKPTVRGVMADMG
jgi:hypothetical protein